MIIGWFTRIAVVLAVVAVVGYDTVAVTAAHLSAKDDADNAAGSAATWIKSNPAGTAAQAQAVADQSLSHGETIVPGTFVVNRDGSVTLTVHRVADRTLVAHHIGLLHGEISFDETATGAAASA